MRLHTTFLGQGHISEALIRVKYAGHVPGDITFTVLERHESRSRLRAYEIRLGSYRPLAGHRRTNGAGSYWAATYDEWGWFIAEIYDLDPSAIFGPYRSRDDFLVKTDYQYNVEANGEAAPLVLDLAEAEAKLPADRDSINREVMGMSQGELDKWRATAAHP